MFTGARSVSSTPREIDDSGARINFELLRDRLGKIRLDVNQSAYFRLDEILVHREFFEEYPELGTIEVAVNRMGNPNPKSHFSGRWSSQRGSMELDYDQLSELIYTDAEIEKQLTSVALHEAQHAIQFIEKTKESYLLSDKSAWLKAITTMVEKDPQKLNEVAGEVSNFIGPGLLTEEGFQKISTSVAFLQDSLHVGDLVKAKGQFAIEWDTEKKVRIENMRQAINSVGFALYMLSPHEVEAREVQARFLGEEVRKAPTINVSELEGAIFFKTPERSLLHVKFALTRLSIQAAAIPSRLMAAVMTAANVAIDAIKKYSSPRPAPSDQNRRERNQLILETHKVASLPMTRAGLAQMRAAMGSEAKEFMRTTQNAYEGFGDNKQTTGFAIEKKGLALANAYASTVMGQALVNMQTMRAQRVAEQPSAPS